MDKNGFETLYKAFTFVKQEISSDLAINQLLIFLQVCMNEGITMYDLREKLDLKQNTISWNVKVLGKYVENIVNDNPVFRGYELIKAEQDLIHRERMALYLTPKGKKLKEELEKLLRG